MCGVISVVFLGPIYQKSSPDAETLTAPITDPLAWMLTVCAETTKCSLALCDISLRLLPYREILWRLPNLSPSPSSVYNKPAALPGSSPSDGKTHPSPAFLYVCLSLLYSLSPHLGQSLRHAGHRVEASHFTTVLNYKGK